MRHEYSWVLSAFQYSFFSPSARIAMKWKARPGAVQSERSESTTPLST